MDTAPADRILLSPEQRLRLRPDVDPDALGRLLAAVPAERRPLFLRHCEPDVLPEGARAEPTPGLAEVIAARRPPSPGRPGVRVLQTVVLDVRLRLDDAMAPLYAAIFNGSTSTRGRQPLALRIPYRRTPRVIVDAPGAPDLDDLTADPEAPPCTVPVLDASRWVVHETDPLPRSIGRLAVRVPGEYLDLRLGRAGGAPPLVGRLDGARARSEPYELGTWGIPWRGADEPDTHWNTGLDRVLTLWVGSESGYPVNHATTPVRLLAAAECRLDVGPWAVWVVYFTLATEARRTFHVAAYWEIAPSLWVRLFSTGRSEDAQREALTVLRSLAVR